MSQLIVALGAAYYFDYLAQAAAWISASVPSSVFQSPGVAAADSELIRNYKGTRGRACSRQPRCSSNPLMSWARTASPSMIDQKPSSRSAFLAGLRSVAMVAVHWFRDSSTRRPITGSRGGVPEVFMASTVVHVSAHQLVTAPETDVALVAARFTCNTSVGTSSPSSSRRSSSWRLAAISAPAFLASVLWSTKRATPEGISSIEPLSARCQLHRRAAYLSSNEHH